MRQGGRKTVHFDDGFGPACPVLGAEGSPTTTDVHDVYCGRCEKTPAFKQAWATRNTSK